MYTAGVSQRIQQGRVSAKVQERAPRKVKDKIFVNVNQTFSSELNDKHRPKLIDPAVALAHKFRLKCNFRRIVRLALANSYWLIQEAEQYEGVDDVKKRVAQAMRKQPTKRKRLLTLADKALLNKPATDRTEKENKYIYRIIGGLKCFKRYPNHVKRRLAAVTYFKYYGPGRTIVRQHDEGHAMYFIVSGEVSITHLVYDGFLKKDVPVEIGVMHAGDYFGEVSLLHDIPRTATCSTTDHCELLALMKKDFKKILQATMQVSWDIVNTAMSFFTYFNGLDEVTRREGCIIARMKSYNINDIILGDNAGVPNFVYFVLSGSCQMIETINVIENTRLGQTSYTLYDPEVSSLESDKSLDAKYLMNLDKDSMDTTSMSRNNSTVSTVFKALDSLYHIGEPSTTKSLNETNYRSSLEMSSYDIPDESNITATKDPTNQEKYESTGLIEYETSAEPKASAIRTSGRHNESVRFSKQLSILLPSAYAPPPGLRTYFMQVCQFNPGSTFGFGENMRDRRIVALTPVECMLMPKIWLLQCNTANIWTRIRHYLEKKIPTKEQLFKNFEIERRWGEYREQLVNDVVARSNAVNATSIHDVPYSIRMEEMTDV